jgi:hypothetical protein
MTPLWVIEIATPLRSSHDLLKESLDFGLKWDKKTRS